MSKDGQLFQFLVQSPVYYALTLTINNAVNFSYLGNMIHLELLLRLWNFNKKCELKNFLDFVEAVFYMTG